MKLKSLQNLFTAELKDLYSAERQLIKALPRMVKAASSEELRQRLTQDLDDARERLRRLDEVCERLGIRKRKKSKPMAGLIKQGKGLIRAKARPEVLDAALIAAAQRMKHYEIAGYGCARTHAHHLGDEQTSQLLQQTLNEQKEADLRLTQLAEQFINSRARTAQPQPAPSAAEEDRPKPSAPEPAESLA